MLHSLRVTLIFDCICYIRGWPACHTRFDPRSICQLRCTSPSPSTLQKLILLVPWRCADGFKTEILKTILSMEIQRCGDVKRKLNFYVLSSHLLLLLSLSLSLSCPVKYAKYLEGYSVEGVRHIFKKACTIHLPKKPTVHLLWAAFEEQQGNILRFTVAFVVVIDRYWFFYNRYRLFACLCNR